MVIVEEGKRLKKESDENIVR